MSLAQRLDRLRGKATSDDAAAGAVSTAGVPLSAAAHPPDHRAADLARALGGQLVDGVVQVSRHWRPAGGAAVDLGALDRLPEVFGSGASDWVYLDTETTGLSGGVGTLVFMVGVARLDANGLLQVRQFVLTAFASERALLQQVVDWIGGNALIVSYNGKCFDMPLLQARLRMHHITHGLGALRHLDLMYAVRCAFRTVWPDCRLQTAERRLLGHVRTADLPGSAAPTAWLRWLRERHAQMLADVARHNFDDVVSLARLHAALPSVFAGEHPVAGDASAIGRAWWRYGHDARTQALWETVLPCLDEAAGLQLAAMYRRKSDWARATALWQRLARAGSAVAACELSKYYEHRMRDPALALTYAVDCRPVERSARVARLQRKLASGPQLSFWPPASANAMK